MNSIKGVALDRAGISVLPGTRFISRPSKLAGALAELEKELEKTPDPLFSFGMQRNLNFRIAVSPRSIR
jgi:hypothetical protein